MEGKIIAEEEETGRGEIKNNQIGEDGQGRQAGSYGGNGPEARGGNPRETG